MSAAYNFARLAEYLTRYRLNGATVTPTDGAWTITRTLDGWTETVTVWASGDASVYVSRRDPFVDAAVLVECGRCTSAMDAERLILDALSTLTWQINADTVTA